MNNLFVYSFYTFKIINNIGHVKTIFDNFLREKYIKGTILVAKEGINGTISGSKKDLDEFIELLKYSIKLKTLAIKVNKTNIHPFNRIKVRIKNEIVSLGQGSIDVCKYRGKLINPETWDSLISDKNTKVIDVRNEFEISIGKFAGSINPETKSFRHFPNAIKNLNINKNDTIAMYCTGGIRCEKASAYLKLKGYKNVYQLEGGILNYLKHKQKKKESLWKGECFVFDNRVTVNRFLDRGVYSQCYGCRSPITENDKKRKEYKKGVSCHNCFYKRTKKQFQRSNSRQKQLHSK